LYGLLSELVAWQMSTFLLGVALLDVTNSIPPAAAATMAVAVAAAAVRLVIVVLCSSGMECPSTSNCQGDD
jgi:hypothetical protein